MVHLSHARHVALCLLHPALVMADAATPSTHPRSTVAVMPAVGAAGDGSAMNALKVSTSLLTLGAGAAAVLHVASRSRTVQMWRLRGALQRPMRVRGATAKASPASVDRALHGTTQSGTRSSASSGSADPGATGTLRFGLRASKAAPFKSLEDMLQLNFGVRMMQEPLEQLLRGTPHAPIIVEGPEGCGKSRTINQVLHKRWRGVHVNCEELHVATGLEFVMAFFEACGYYSGTAPFVTSALRALGIDRTDSEQASLAADVREAARLMGKALGDDAKQQHAAYNAPWRRWLPRAFMGPPPTVPVICIENVHSLRPLMGETAAERDSHIARFLEWCRYLTDNRLAHVILVCRPGLAAELGQMFPAMRQVGRWHFAIPCPPRVVKAALLTRVNPVLRSVGASELSDAAADAIARTVGTNFHELRQVLEALLVYRSMVGSVVGALGDGGSHGSDDARLEPGATLSPEADAAAARVSPNGIVTTILSSLVELRRGVIEDYLDKLLEERSAAQSFGGSVAGSSRVGKASALQHAANAPALLALHAAQDAEAADKILRFWACLERVAQAGMSDKGVLRRELLGSVFAGHPDELDDMEHAGILAPMLDVATLAESIVAGHSSDGNTAGGDSGRGALGTRKGDGVGAAPWQSNKGAFASVGGTTGSADVDGEGGSVVGPSSGDTAIAAAAPAADLGTPNPESQLWMYASTPSLQAAVLAVVGDPNIRKIVEGIAEEVAQRELAEQEAMLSKRAELHARIRTAATSAAAAAAAGGNGAGSDDGTGAVRAWLAIHEAETLAELEHVRRAQRERK